MLRRREEPEPEPGLPPVGVGLRCRYVSRSTHVANVLLDSLPRGAGTRQRLAGAAVRVDQPALDTLDLLVGPEAPSPRVAVRPELGGQDALGLPHPQSRRHAVEPLGGITDVDLRILHRQLLSATSTYIIIISQTGLNGSRRSRAAPRACTRASRGP